MIKSRIKSAIVLKKNLIETLWKVKKYIRTKKKSYKGKINTINHNGKMLKQGSHCILLSIVLINYFVRTD